MTKSMKDGSNSDICLSWLELGRTSTNSTSTLGSYHLVFPSFAIYPNRTCLQYIYIWNTVNCPNCQIVQIRVHTDQDQHRQATRTMKALSVFTIIYGGSIISLHVLLLLRVGFFCFLSSYFVFAGGSSSLAVVPPQEDIKELVEQAAESNDLKGLGRSNVDVLEVAESLVAKSDFSKRTRRRRYTNCKLQVASLSQVCCKSVASLVM